MGRMAATWLVALLLCALVPSSLPFENAAAPSLADHETVAQTGASSLTVVFSNGPVQDESVTGNKALAFGVSGTGTLDSLLIEISADGVAWTSLVNLTSSPWIYPFDTTNQANDSYMLRATGWDSSASAFTNATTDWFNITNQVPLITTFTVLNPDAGTGQSLNDRAWFNIGSQDSLSFRWGASDDDLKQATLTNVPGPGTPSTDGPSNLAYGWDWSSGNMAEGTWSPRLTVSDHSGLSSTSTLFVGIDRTGPSIGSVTVGDGTG